MKSFHNDQSIKDKYLARVLNHQKDDHLIRGTGWKDGKGCAVGCTLEKYDHAAYETELGIPKWLAHLEDHIFEKMSEDKSKTWPYEFLKSIPVGVDLNKIRTPFLIMIIKEWIKYLDDAKYDEDAFPGVKKVITQVKSAVLEMIRAHETGNGLDEAKESARCASVDANNEKWKFSGYDNPHPLNAIIIAEAVANIAIWSAENIEGDNIDVWSGVNKNPDMFADQLLKLIRECV